MTQGLSAWRAVIAAIVLAGAHATSLARTQAVLVGVSSYPSLEPSLQLHGPRFDVQSYRQMLLSRGVAQNDIHVLADGVDGGAEPTRAAILSALRSVADRARPGDFVLLTMSGHGSQQPVGRNPQAEPDGLDEIFLPRDIGRWDGDTRAVRNAITDDEIGSAITQIRSQGAFVWAVFDVCHAGTFMRGTPLAYEQVREVPPEALGVDPALMAKARARSGRMTSARASRGYGASQSVAQVSTEDPSFGGFVAFYASQSYETTQELTLPENAPDAHPRGLFSFTLQQVLATDPTATYRQAIERILQIYDGMGRSSPTPDLEGTALDAPLMGAMPGGRAIRQWLVDRSSANALSLRAGLMHDVTPGSILAIVPSALSKDDMLIGFARVVSATTTSATLEPAAYRGRPAFKVESVGSNAYARPVDLKIDFAIRVSRPARSDACAAPSAAVARAIARLEAEQAATRVRWVAPGAAADVRLCQQGDILKLLDSSAVVGGTDVPNSARVDAGSSDRVARDLNAALSRISRVLKLTRLSAQATALVGLETTLLLHPGCKQTHQTCDSSARTLVRTSRPAVHSGDRITVHLANPLYQPVDVTVLYIDAAYGITVLFPSDASGGSPRLSPRAAADFGFSLTANPLGLERMMIIAVPVTPKSSEMNFADLAQEGISVGRRDGNEAPDIEAYSAGAGFITYAWSVRSGQ